jgi:hypothetical protein
MDLKSDGGEAAVRVWMIPIDKSLLPEGNPFAWINMKGSKRSAPLYAANRSSAP